MYKSRACFVALVVVSYAAFTVLATATATAAGGGGGGATNNWAVIVSTSRYWHNYRHSGNALSFYHVLKDNGISDDRIILVLSDTHACDPRNDKPATIFNNKDEKINLYSCDVQVDVVGYEADIRTVLGILQGRYEKDTPLTRQLRSDENSHVLIYFTGHGGDGFMKFQDQEYLSSEDIGQTIDMMHAQRRFKKLLFVAETCHAQSLCKYINAPGAICVASAATDEDTYSHHRNDKLGVWAIDYFTYGTLNFMQTRPKVQQESLRSWLSYYTYQNTQSTVKWKGLDEYGADLRVGDFFGFGRTAAWRPVPIREDLF